MRRIDSQKAGPYRSFRESSKIGDGLLVVRQTCKTAEVAIIGAGPYGLAVAAYLRATGIEPHVFGTPMEFWQRQMPRGMWLRSPSFASNIASPNDRLGLDKYAAITRVEIANYMRLEEFIAYGQWFQEHAIPSVDPRKVSQLNVDGSGFRLVLQDGEPFAAERVVIAAGVGPFAYRPPQFDGLASELASHSSDHSDLGQFRGAHVAVIGAGQSAFESAALLLEGGAQVEVILRAARVCWIVPRLRIASRRTHVRALLFPPTAVGPIGWHFPPINHIVARPHLLRMLPKGLQRRISYASIRPAVLDQLKPRVAGARITPSCNVVSATAANGTALLALDDGSERHVDHVLLATGYHVDLSRYQFIAPQLLRTITCSAGYPRLTPEFRSSVPGLFFVGAVAAENFGPLLRFVSGTGYCAKTVARAIMAEIFVTKHVFGRRPPAKMMNRQRRVLGSEGRPYLRLRQLL